MAVDLIVPEAEEGVEIEVMTLYVEAGATVSEGDLLVEVATDKANVDVPAPVGGVVAEIFVTEGEILPATTVLMRLDEE